MDDEPHVLRALQWLLQKEFEIHTAGTAAEGLRLVQRHDFDVVVSDQRMPGITGVEFLRQVRRLAPRAMRIMLTGYSDLDAMVKSVNESEVFRFITKPWDIRSLPKLIAEAAEIARAETAAADAEEIEGARGEASNVIPIGRTAAVPAHAAGAAHHARTQCGVTTVAVHASESVLVIDDSPDVHQAITRVAGNTVRVLHAYSLADAARVLAEQPVGVIISDIRVGSIDATRLIRLLKKDNPAIVSVVFSAQRDAEVVMSLINEGQVYRFIPKPFNAGYVRIVLDSALKRYRALLENPTLVRRYAVDAAFAGTADSLIGDIGRLSGIHRDVVPAAEMLGASAPGLTSSASPAGSEFRTGLVDESSAHGKRGVLSKLNSRLWRRFGS